VKLELEPHRFESLIGGVLIIGVTIAAVVVAAGAAALLAQHGRAIPTFDVFRGVEQPLTTFRGIWRGALALDSESVVQLGLVLLIATPICRVGLTFVAFVAQRDWLYSALTVVVLAVLIYGLIAPGR
jgi:uncharacterized membrane protein